MSKKKNIPEETDKITSEKMNGASNENTEEQVENNPKVPNKTEGSTETPGFKTKIDAGEKVTTGITKISGGEKTFSIQSFGDRRYSAPAAIIVDRFRSHFDEWISVPVATILPTFQFHFKRYLEANALTDLNVNDDVIRSIAEHLLFYRTKIGLKVRSFADQLVDGAFISTETKDVSYAFGQIRKNVYDRLKEVNLEDDAIKDIIILLIDNIDRYMVRGVLTQNILRASMEDEITQLFVNSSQQLHVDPNTVLGTIAVLQQFYASVCVTDSVDAFGQTCANLSKDDDNLRFVYSLRRILAETRSPFVSVRFGALRETFEEAQDIKPTVKKENILGGLVTRAVDVTSEFNDIRRRDIFAFLFYCYGKFVGDRYVDNILEPVSIEEQMKAALNWSQQANRGFLGFPEEWYNSKFFSSVGYDPASAVATGAQPFSDPVVSLFKRIFLDKMLEKTMQPIVAGAFSSRVKSLINERTLSTSDMWNMVINRALDAATILIDAFSSTLAYMRSMASDLSIIYTDDDDRYTPDLVAFINNNINKLGTPTLPLSHPASIHELSVLLQEPSDYETPAYPGLTMNDDMFKSLEGGVYDPVNDEFKYFFMNSIVKGTLLDCPINLPRPIIANGLITKLQPRFTFSFPIENELITTPLGQTILRYVDVQELLTSGYYYMLYDKIEFRTYTSAQSLSDDMMIPLDVARRVINNSFAKGDIFFVAYYNGPLSQTIVFDQYQLPILEVGKLPSEEQYLKTQFVARWPFYATTQHKGFLLPPDVALGVSGSYDLTRGVLLEERDQAIKSAYLSQRFIGHSGLVNDPDSLNVRNTVVGTPSRSSDIDTSDEADDVVAQDDRLNNTSDTNNTEGTTSGSDNDDITDLQD